MRSGAPGKCISDVEVTNLSNHGFWILVQGRELFVAFEHFPWFREAPVGHILAVEMPGPDHLYWPNLDADLSVESIERPEDFPLVSRLAVGKAKRSAPERRHRKPDGRGIISCRE